MSAKRASAALTALLVALAVLVLPARPAYAACHTSQQGTVAGGYRVRIACGAQSFDGFGATVGDANREATLLYQLYVDSGYHCSSQAVSSVTGGVRVRQACSGRDIVDGFGTVLNHATVEARKLAELYAVDGIQCSGQAVSRSSGVYRARLRCGGRAVDGLGATVTEAAQNARLTAAAG